MYLQVNIKVKAEHERLSSNISVIEKDCAVGLIVYSELSRLFKTIQQPYLGVYVVGDDGVQVDEVGTAILAVVEQPIQLEEVGRRHQLQDVGRLHA